MQPTVPQGVIEAASRRAIRDLRLVHAPYLTVLCLIRHTAPLLTSLVLTAQSLAHLST